MINRVGISLNIMKKPKNILNKIASKHDTCYSVGKNKNDCDRIMVKKLIIYHIKKDLGEALL